MFDLPINISFNNTYIFTVVDTKKNKIKQVVETKNIVLNTYWEDIVDRSRFYYLKVGSGTKKPEITDTNLEAPLWRGQYFKPESSTFKAGYPNSLLTHNYVLPEVLSLVGDISEVGLAGDYVSIGTRENDIVRCYTRALLQDAEGNPIVIHKTNSDRILITVKIEISFYSLTKNFRLVPPEENRILQGFKNSRKGIFKGLIEGNNLSPGVSFLTRKDTYFKAEECFRNYRHTPIVKYDIESKALITEKARTTSDIAKYFNRVEIIGLGEWDFPEESIFPNQTLSNMKIGVGDGSTSEYKCPLNYFIKDTDKVYKNDVLLKRNIDYTIDNENNQDMFIELSLGNSAKITGGIIGPFDDYYEGLVREIFKDNYAQYRGLRSNSEGLISFTASKPLFFTCLTPQKCNTLHLSNGFEAATYTVSYSDDGIAYKKCFQGVKASLDEVATFSFDTIIAKYWKIETTSENPSMCSFYNGIDSFFGYIGKGIVFKTPPAVGDVLKMEAQIDRPFVNPNLVLDFACCISF